MMHALERWVLRVADSDLTWIGLNWLRPPKHKPLGLAYVILSSLLLGLPGVVVSAALIVAVMGRIDLRVCLLLVLVVTMVELPLNLLLAHFWNRRAKGLGEGPMTWRCLGKRL